MKIVKPLTLGCLTRSYRIGGKRRFVVSALGFFPLGRGTVQRFAMESEQWAGALEVLAQQGCGSVQPLDEVLPKHRAEVLVGGSAYAPDGKPVVRMQVTLAAAGIDKTLDIVGERAWRYDPWLRIDEPRPFVSMPLTYVNAFGGPHHRGNPIGRGYSRNRFAALVGTNTGPMPTVELPGQPVRRHWVRYAPAGFGPLAFEWEPRARHAGRYGAKWLAHEAPGFSSSAQPALFQRAPRDQWLSAYLQGGEAYRLTGMHPDHAIIEGTVPRLAARAFVRRSGAPQIEAVALHFDTLWFFPDRMLGVAIYHGETDHAHPLAFDIEGVMVAYEHLDRPRSFQHYADVYARRTDPSIAMAHLFNDAELAADYDAPTFAARAAATAAREADAKAARAARLAAQLAEFPSTGPASAASGPAAPLPPLPVPASVAIAESDFDLGPTLDGARAIVAQARAQADMLRAQYVEPAAAASPPDLAARSEAAFARAAKPARDLGPAGPVLTTATAARQGLAAGAAATPADASAQLDATLDAQAAGQRAARRARMQYVDPDGPLPSDLARWLGMQAVQWHRAGVSLAGRDLAGVDLQGCDFSGADLREIQLENADLRHARFVGARLDRAALSGARLDGADFSNAVLFDANLAHTRGKNVRFAGADLRKAWMMDADWETAELNGARLDQALASGWVLSGACLQGVSAEQAVMMNAKAKGSDWRGATLFATVLMRAELSGASFDGATLRKAVLADAKCVAASFERATLVDVTAGGSEADWSNVRAAGVRAEHCSWQQTRLADSDWHRARLSACDFGRADLSGAQLSEAILSGCLFTGATLAFAQCRRTDLMRAVCRSANFTGATLVGASLYQADFSDALLEGADLRDARWEPGRRAVA